MNAALLDTVFRAAVSHHRAGDLSAAIQAYRAVRTLVPDLPVPYSNLGFLLYESGRAAEAIPLLEQALILEPAFGQAAHNLLLASFWSAPAYRWAEVARGLRAGFTNDPAACYELHIRGAIAHWIAGDRPALAATLRACEDIRPASGQSLAYEHFLSALLRQNEQEAPSSAPISVIGDSHCLSYASRWVRPHLIMGCKAWHLAAPGENRFKTRLAEYLRAEQPGAMILISAGEIDCRRDEGILTALDKYGGSLDRAIETTVAGLVNTVLGLADGLDIRFCAVPAPARSSASREQADLIRKFNAALREQAGQAGSGIADFYAVTAADDGMANDGVHIDGIHLAPSLLRAALQPRER